jgi:hypothetical protein
MNAATFKHKLPIINLNSAPRANSAGDVVEIDTETFAPTSALTPSVGNIERTLRQIASWASEKLSLYREVVDVTDYFGEGVKPSAIVSFNDPIEIMGCGDIQLVFEDSDTDFFE